MLTQRLNERGATEDDARLRTTEKFISASQHKIRTVCDAGAKVWFAECRKNRILKQLSATDVVEHHQPTRMRQCREFQAGRFGREADNAKVRSVYAQNCRSPFSDR